MRLISIVFMFTIFVLLGTTQIVPAGIISTIDDLNDIISIDSNGDIISNDNIEPDIDINKISYNIEDENIILYFIIDGFINNSPRVEYKIYFNTSNSSYWFKYSNNTMDGGSVNFTNNENYDDFENFTIDSHIITVIYESMSQNIEYNDITFWGFAKKIKNDNSIFIDLIPNNINYTINDVQLTNDSNYSSNSHDDETVNSPGFDSLTYLCIFFVVLFLFIKKRGNY